MKFNLVTFPTASPHAESCKTAVTNRPTDLAETVRMAREKILRLEKTSRVSSIEVKSGVVWLTGTPAKGDVLLSGGERFLLENDWPYVIQALEEAELVLGKKG